MSFTHATSHIPTLLSRLRLRFFSSRTTTESQPDVMAGTDIDLWKCALMSFVKHAHNADGDIFLKVSAEFHTAPEVLV